MNLYLTNSCISLFVSHSFFFYFWLDFRIHSGSWAAFVLALEKLHANKGERIQVGWKRTFECYWETYSFHERNYIQNTTRQRREVKVDNGVLATIISWWKEQNELKRWKAVIKANAICTVFCPAPCNAKDVFLPSTNFEGILFGETSQLLSFRRKVEPGLCPRPRLLHILEMIKAWIQLFLSIIFPWFRCFGIYGFCWANIATAAGNLQCKAVLPWIEMADDMTTTFWFVHYDFNSSQVPNFIGSRCQNQKTFRQIHRTHITLKNK